jgi:hypothetical protein
MEQKSRRRTRKGRRRNRKRDGNIEALGGGNAVRRELG